DHRLDLLVGGTRDAPRRQQTLRAALDWSHDCLDQAEMMIFRRLAVFAGGFSLQAAEAVCSDASIQSAGVLQALKGLVTKSLIVLDSDRYGCLETIHEYAAEQLGAASETRAVSAQHTAYYFGLASARRPGQLQAWLHEMDSEVDNLRSALRWLPPTTPTRPFDWRGPYGCSGCIAATTPKPGMYSKGSQRRRFPIPCSASGPSLERLFWPTSAAHGRLVTLTSSRSRSSPTPSVNRRPS